MAYTLLVPSSRFQALSDAAREQQDADMTPAAGPTMNTPSATFRHKKVLESRRSGRPEGPSFSDENQGSATGQSYFHTESKLSFPPMIDIVTSRTAGVSDGIRTL